jgi:hypothetical protein
VLHFVSFSWLLTGIHPASFPPENVLTWRIENRKQKTTHAREKAAVDKEGVLEMTYQGELILRGD